MGSKKMIHSLDFARGSDKKINLLPEVASIIELPLLHMTVHVFFEHVCITCSLRL